MIFCAASGRDGVHPHPATLAVDAGTVCALACRVHAASMAAATEATICELPARPA
ncbi:MAG: hypothetical protein ACRDRK_06470 [Pseudonocardia sp.]